MEVRSDPFESAKSHFFDTSSWGEFCDVTLTLKQAWQPDRGGWLKIETKLEQGRLVSNRLVFRLLAAPDSSAPTREPEMPERKHARGPRLFWRDRSRWRATP